MKKIIKMEYSQCDYTCMWNGIENLYTRKTGEKVPGFMFFCLGGIGNSIYMKFKNEQMPRMAMFNDGRPLKMYSKVNKLVGFEYHFTDGSSFNHLIRKAKRQIDIEKPVILGPLDMYYLPYLKMYHRYHIPFHYIMMTGYDEENEVAYIYDCGREGIQTISFNELEAALAVKKTELGDRNGILAVDFANEIPNLYQIAKEGFAKKAIDQLSSKAGFVGINGIRKLANEFSAWDKELSEMGYRNSLKLMVEYMGNVPKVPNLLMGINEPDEISYQACRDSMSKLFEELYDRYDCMQWKAASELFKESGILLEKIAQDAVNYLLGKKESLCGTDKLLYEIADLEEAAYRKCMEV